MHAEDSFDDEEKAWAEWTWCGIKDHGGLSRLEVDLIEWRGARVSTVVRRSKNEKNGGEAWANCFISRRRHVWRDIKVEC